MRGSERRPDQVDTILQTFTLIEVTSEAISVVAGTVTFFVVQRLIPNFGFLLQRRALRFILAAALFFVAAELLAVVEAVFAPATSPAVALLEDLAEVSVIVLVGLAAVAFYRSEQEDIASLRRAADLDELTALANRAFFRRAARRRISLSRENGLPLACMVMDIDDFKPYNDEFGHEAGDRALVCVARAMQGLARADDITARQGGEEFVLLMNGSLEDAAAVAERIRAQVEEACFPGRNEDLLREITISLGVGRLSDETDTLEKLVEAADREMYRAKRAGKNRVFVTGQE